MIGDLHCHTKLSDGSMGLEDVIYFAKRAGLDFVSITDHDTMAGITRAVVLGKRYGINVIPGVEFSCIDNQRGRKVHILCYLPQKPDRLEGLCNKILDGRTKAGLEMIKRVSRFYPITADFVARYYAGSKSIYKQHIMNALMDLGYTDRIFGDVFTQLFDSEKGLICVDVEYPDTYEVLDLIHLAGGIAVLAHPHEYDSLELLNELLEKEILDGIEVYHPRNTEEDTKKLEQLADRYGVLKFGGTDFHGFYTKSYSPLATCVTPHETLNQIFKQKKQSV
ncbi:PHP domain-containing protein [Hydrogenoanaerobacterium sp.]|uniref:PHP domain-containing protein n=1 Tax=Hydrogenoanaerobacterium sp. TaxID=2953763 RepID=UPI00289883DA|nr:PHP domain-containing protein [Hydrogenoanaerobacterium sp.]